MIIMFWRNTAVLILIQLIQAQQVFAAPSFTEHRSLEVSRGDSVTLTCNVRLLLQKMCKKMRVSVRRDSLQFPQKLSVFVLNAIEEDDGREHGDEGMEFQL
ncbi:hypothetical protein OJAV_G00203660 [Oryzias javanicus]|uniref:Immunoglobulin V-set domain-containing protein n=1 Tax=Oryzias javanicus TaxID=123683 RepID=A0A3S2PQ62_ORYJA|nr:hypothetical protein OJAV_G00203660 [Oryzias javanicus]